MADKDKSSGGQSVWVLILVQLLTKETLPWGMYLKSLSQFLHEKYATGTSLTAQGLWLHASNARGTGSIPASETKVLHAMLCGQKKRNMYMTMCKIDGQWEFAIWCREVNYGALWQPRGVGWGGRWEEGLRGRNICIPIADACWCMEETTQYCKAVILQLKINFKKETWNNNSTYFIDLLKICELYHVKHLDN